MHPDMQNEVIEIMALEVFRNKMQTLKIKKYYSVIIDETMDTSVTKHVSFDSSLQVHDTFAGFHRTSMTNDDDDTSTSILSSS